MEDKIQNLNREEPSYYATIPGRVRYDKDLIPAAKLFYGEITALSNKFGYCFATNKYFMRIYKVSEQTITNWINSLKSKNYIRVELIKDEKGQILERRIYIMEENLIKREEDLIKRISVLESILENLQKDVNIDTQEKLGRGTQEKLGRGTQEKLGRGTQEKLGNNTISINRYHGMVKEEKEKISKKILTDSFKNQKPLKKISEEKNSKPYHTMVEDFFTSKKIGLEDQHYVEPLKKWVDFKVKNGHFFENLGNMVFEFEELEKLVRNTGCSPEYLVDWNIKKNYMKLFAPEKKQDGGRILTSTPSEEKKKEEPKPILKREIKPEFRECDEKLRENFGEKIYNAWLTQLDFKGLEEYQESGEVRKKFVFNVPTNFIRDLITKEYLNGNYRFVNGEKVYFRKGISHIVQECFDCDSVDIVSVKKNGEF